MPSSPLNGIIAHLTRQYGGNVHTHAVVSITASSFLDAYPPQHAADLETASLFETQNLANSWICYDFKGMKVTPSHYSIRSYVWRPGNQHLRNWVLEGSSDGRSWVELDRKDNNTDLNDRSAVCTFTVSHPIEIRMIRLRLFTANMVRFINDAGGIKSGPRSTRASKSHDIKGTIKGFTICYDQCLKRW